MLWEPSGQQAGGEARPVGTWRWGGWMDGWGSILLGGAGDPGRGGSQGLSGNPKLSRDAEGAGWGGSEKVEEQGG